MKSINWKTMLENNALIIVFVVAVVFSNFTFFFDLKLGGVVLTLYRVCIPIICIYCMRLYMVCISHI